MFKKPSHKYPTNFSHNNFSLKKRSLNSTKYSISFRGPKLWNEFLNTDEKQISSYNLFSRKVKSKLLDTENELKYFWNFAEIVLKLTWVFGYKRVQSFGGALLEGVFWDLFALERPCWSATSVKLHDGFVGVALRLGCSLVDLVVFLGARFYDSTSGGLLLHTKYSL